ncbi:glycerophosphodiester phosphodiesterase [Actinomyces sp. zg-332]|uniref:glycerophosphodiester phosphodiesterase n=1 Tax=Actinomyces sp. zg-332 TaxID=2708340 RepID=UPI001420F934|nr:glycerophosphodiester phosphodiesterase [Actinomyces sp. zg-332]QPK94405.1 glycerophosphodiester phosphodiesterase [Actinomyces sp. zg-332]
MYEVIVIPHRGGCNEAIENSWVALEHAHSLGYKYFETDVRATKDNVVVIYHDDTLERVNNHTGRVEDMTWEELSQISYSDGSQIVRLEDALKKYSDLHFNIDLKNDRVVQPMIDLLSEMPEVEDRILIASFSSTRLRRIRKAFNGRIKTSLSMAEVIKMKLASTLTISPRLFGVPYPRQGVVAVQVPVKFGFIKVVTKRFISACHRRGMAVQVWVVDDPSEMEYLIDLGVDGLFTDSPSVAKQLLIDKGLWK